ncbi:MAG: glucokinase [Cyanobacteria bacterium REEB459]|nr:glucokinase [Cyanobacteria bacterium REEB459]
MTYLLAGDIGGTKTLLGLLEGHSPLSLRICFEATYASQTYADLVPMVREFLRQGADQIGPGMAPAVACFAIAGPVVANRSNLTNLAWFLDGDRLQAELHLTQVSLINDFEAVGYGVFGLTPEDLHPLQVGKPQIHAPMAVIGAGTGLGQSFALTLEGYPRVFASEGGHADFAPRSELEFQLLHYLLDKHQISRVHVGRVVSGRGIVSLYQFLRDRGFAAESASVAEAITRWERQRGRSHKTIDPAAVIATAAATGDPLCQKAMAMFVEAYGAEAGNLALQILPYGGLYVAGGIAAKNLALMTAGNFMAAFTHKGRVSSLLQNVPVHIVLNPRVGLIGAGVKAATLMPKA